MELYLAGEARPPRGAEAKRRRLSGFGVDAAVVGALKPGPQQPVQLGQGELGALFGLREELLAQGPKEALDLAPPLRAPGP